MSKIIIGLLRLVMIVIGILFTLGGLAGSLWTIWDYFQDLLFNKGVIGNFSLTPGVDYLVLPYLFVLGVFVGLIYAGYRQRFFVFCSWTIATSLVLAACSFGTGVSGESATLSATYQAGWTASALENTQRELPRFLGEACAGVGVAGTAAYTTEGEFHPVVWVSEKNWMWQPEWRTGFPPNNWLPQNLNETQLVACESEEELVIEVCTYDGPDITRFAYETTIRVVEALTGNLVAESSFQGSLPRACKETEVLELTELRGEHVSSQLLQEWLKDFVGEPGN